MRTMSARIYPRSWESPMRKYGSAFAFLVVLLTVALCLPGNAFATDWAFGLEGVENATDALTNETFDAEGTLEDLERDTNETQQTAAYNELASLDVIAEEAQNDTVITEDERTVEVQEDQTGMRDEVLVEDESKVAVTTAAVEASAPKMTGRAYVERKGWMSWRKNVVPGKILTLGTTGKSRRLEAICIKVQVEGRTGGITYQTHVQNKGWTKEKSNGKVSGSKGKSLRMEAMRCKLTGDLANEYDVWYRAHVSGVGWMAWAKNWKNCGTTGFSRRVEAVQVVLLPKNSSAPTQDASCSLAYVPFSAGKVKYSSMVNKKWQKYVSPARVSGTTGKSKHVSAIRATYTSKKGLSGKITYSAHLAYSGWSTWKKNGTTAGGKSKKVEAIAFKLSGEASKLYDIWYRAHVSKAGWLGWAKNGDPAGSTGASKTVEAYQVKLVPKGASAPGSTENSCVGKNYFLDSMTQRAMGYSSGTGYLIMIDNGNSRVGIYEGHQGDWKRIQYWPASMGKSETPTVRGEFMVTDKGYVFGDGYSCYYWTRFYEDYLFHSILYNEGTRDVMDGSLGYNVSHGCVRLAIENAKWIQDNIPYGTKVVSY